MDNLKTTKKAITHYMIKIYEFHAGYNQPVSYIYIIHNTKHAYIR